MNSEVTVGQIVNALLMKVMVKKGTWTTQVLITVMITMILQVTKRVIATTVMVTRVTSDNDVSDNENIEHDNNARALHWILIPIVL